MSIQHKRVAIISAIVAFILAIPLITMQFSAEVNWNIGDFIEAGILQFGTGLLMDWVIRKVKQRPFRIVICLGILFLLLLVWVELAVGIFGTPLAGS